MKLLHRLKHTTDKNGTKTELDILLYESKIIWYYTEMTRFDDGDEFTEDQSYDDYIKHGPPPFADDLSPEKLKEIDLIINRKQIH